MKLLDAIFCDDIRQEINGKLSLMGVYNDRIVLNINKQEPITWPQPINLAVLLRFSLDKENEKLDSFAFEYLLNKKNILQIKGELHINTHDTFQLILNGIGIPLEPGNLGFSIKLYSHEKILFHEKNESALIISVS